MKTLIAFFALFVSSLALADTTVEFSGLQLKGGQMVVLTVRGPQTLIYAFNVEEDYPVADKTGFNLGELKAGKYKVDLVVRSTHLGDVVHTESATFNVSN